jgi:DNA-binding transcriptional LysR family regulator
VAQPSLTRAVQLLEHEIGGRLFERSNSSVCLTKLGILLQPHFEAINSAADNIKRAAAEFSEADTVASAETPVASYTRHSPLSQ